MKPVDKIATQRNFTLSIPFGACCIAGSSAIKFPKLVHDATRLAAIAPLGDGLGITRPGYSLASRRIRSHYYLKFSLKQPVEYPAGYGRPLQYRRSAQPKIVLDLFIINIISL